MTFVTFFHLLIILCSWLSLVPWHNCFSTNSTTKFCWHWLLLIFPDIQCFRNTQWQYLLNRPCFFTKISWNAVHSPPQAYSCNWKPFIGGRHGQIVASVSFPVLSLQTLSNCWVWTSKASDVGLWIVKKKVSTENYKLNPKRANKFFFPKFQCISWTKNLLADFPENQSWKGNRVKSFFKAVFRSLVESNELWEGSTGRRNCVAIGEYVFDLGRKGKDSIHLNSTVQAN